jgi:peptide/nickel transport system permease protein
VATAAVGQSPLSAAGELWRRTSGGALGRLAKAIISNRKASAGLVILVAFSFLAVFPGVVARDNPNAEVYAPSLGPSGAHLLGTTAYGQDLFAQLIYSTSQSMFIAVVSGGLATALSVLVGVTSAYIGGLADDVLSLVTDVFLVLPAFPLVVVIAAYSKNGGDAILIAVLVVTGWSYGARQLRVQVLSLRNRDFLVAARLRGERRWRVIFSEILPTMTSLIVAIFLGTTIYSVITAAGLQFVGLGSPGTLSWGTMLYWAQNNEALQAGSPLWAIMPGVCIALLGAGFALLQYAFDEVSNPALRPVRRRRC